MSRLVRIASSAAIFVLPTLLGACGKSERAAELELRSSLVGDWVPLMSEPKGDAASICATDATISLKADGNYEGLFDRGHWQLSDGKLTVVITHSSEGSSGEGPEQALAKPHAMQFEIKNSNDQVLETELKSAKVWLFRCEPS